MARPPKLWKRKEDGWYYTKINGKQHKLSQNHSEAQTLFHTLRKTPGKQGARITLKDASNQFLDHAKLTKAEKTYENQKRYLQALCDDFGKGAWVNDLTGSKVEKWLLGTGWGESTRAAAGASIRACFNWCVKERLLVESPMWGTKRGRFKSRTRILQSDEKKRIKAVVKGNLADFLHFLEMTGCRPFSEAAKVAAEIIDWKDGSITFAEHKTEHQGKDRVIYLTPDLVKRLDDLAFEYPDGPLYRTRTGNPWTPAAVSKAMRKIEKRAKVKRMTVYAWHHTYITDCLAKGMSPTVVGKLVGNSARTIAKFYDHLEQRRDALKQAAIQAVS